MCVVSAIMDHGRREFWPSPAAPWRPEFQPYVPMPQPDSPGIPLKSEALPAIDPVVSAERLKDFLKTVEIAKEYDARTGQPECEDPEKAKVLEAVLARLDEIERMLGIQNPTTEDGLYGSSILAATYLIGGATVSLGDIVCRAFNDSGLTVAAWNDLPEVEREHKLVDALTAMRAEAVG